MVFVSVVKIFVELRLSVFSICGEGPLLCSQRKCRPAHRGLKSWWFSKKFLLWVHRGKTSTHGKNNSKYIVACLTHVLERAFSQDYSYGKPLTVAACSVALSTRIGADMEVFLNMRKYAKIGEVL